MNTAQIEVFGGVVEQLESMGFINLRTENETGVVRFYGCQVQVTLKTCLRPLIKMVKQFSGK
jgi:hypothetical protein